MLMEGRSGKVCTTRPAKDVVVPSSPLLYPLLYKYTLGGRKANAYKAIGETAPLGPQPIRISLDTVTFLYEITRGKLHGVSGDRATCLSDVMT